LEERDLVMIMMREMRRKRTEKTNETLPFSIGIRLLLYFGLKTTRKIVRGIQIRINLNQIL